ncbi:hypothetical protein GCM10023114_59250 [Mycolicibacterium sediminis]|uniref:Uncharacterized protein n=1 Tax=Mycolicibacterium sediminis TaxID=1286180 RepID=A0A7I7QPT3_9MYCO|nr:hypothetical protein MSEDJ_23380 [Mycolicibacterium sediminis]
MPTDDVPGIACAGTPTTGVGAGGSGAASPKADSKLVTTVATGPGVGRADWPEADESRVVEATVCTTGVGADGPSFSAAEGSARPMGSDTRPEPATASDGCRAGTVVELWPGDAKPAVDPAVDSPLDGPSVAEVAPRRIVTRVALVVVAGLPMRVAGLLGPELPAAPAVPVDGPVDGPVDAGCESWVDGADCPDRPD